MSRIFVVKKPCVIECRYFEAGGIYKSSDHMACTALKELIDHGFLEEKLVNMDARVKVDGHLQNMQMLCGYLQHYINELVRELNEARIYREHL